MTQIIKDRQNAFTDYNIKIYDNFITKTYHKEILNMMSGCNFGWFYQNNINGEDFQSVDLEGQGFQHWFWDETGPRHSLETKFILPLIYNIMDITDTNEILRIRGDMTMYSTIGYKHQKHTDFDFPNIAAVYYVNDSDGNTVFSDQEVEPKANRLVTFSGDIPHTGHSPSKHKNRILINSNYIIKK